ncbi:hypothetical protein Hamer_G020698 [Homarus americanus]|uniref:Uncharacterized protein n=1 Tax=Homarus americanus TaxID=6706 RepID=A0A8J5TIT1_HOMAM|nr:hypothetical protein Hamer_G020698 [Homarus americanus]
MPITYYVPGGGKIPTLVLSFNPQPLVCLKHGTHVGHRAYVCSVPPATVLKHYTHVSTSLPTCPLLYPRLHFSTHVSTSLPTSPLLYPRVHFSTHVSTSLPTCPFLYLRVHFSTHFSTYVSIPLPTCPLLYPRLHFSTHVSTLLPCMQRVQYYFTFPVSCPRLAHLKSRHQRQVVGGLVVSSSRNHHLPVCPAASWTITLLRIAPLSQGDTARGTRRTLYYGQIPREESTTFYCPHLHLLSAGHRHTHPCPYSPVPPASHYSPVPPASHYSRLHLPCLTPYLTLPHTVPYPCPHPILPYPTPYPTLPYPTPQSTLPYSIPSLPYLPVVISSTCPSVILPYAPNPTFAYPTVPTLLRIPSITPAPATAPLPPFLSMHDHTLAARPALPHPLFTLFYLFSPLYPPPSF